MSRTVSARIPKEMHEKLRDKCNDLGCSINDYIVGCMELELDGGTQFDFGDEESETVDQAKKDELDSSKSKDNHEGKILLVHFYWENGKLVQGETTWEERPK